LKYGLGNDYTAVVDPIDDLFDHGDFTGTYTYSRGETQNPGCDNEREFAPVFGQFLFRTVAGCVPTTTTGCPIEFATNLWNGVNPSDPNRSFFGGARKIYGDVELTGDNKNDNRLFISLGSVGNLEGRGDLFAIAGSSNVRLRWNAAATTGGATTLCCNSDAPFNFCGVVGGGRWIPYPAINVLAGDASPKMGFPDFIFNGHPATATSFATDDNFTVAGEQYGVCTNNRRWGCRLDEPTDSATCKTFNNELWCDCDRDRCDGNTNHCYDHPAVACDDQNDDPALDPCHALPAASAGSCDVKEHGWDMRADGGELLADFTRNPAKCGTAMYFWRGYRNQHCALAATYAQNGDPGSDCWILNFGGHIRADDNCDGFSDTDPDAAGPQPDKDKCPRYTETNPLGDANGNGRGDECECGDVSPIRTRADLVKVGGGDGKIDVADIVGINTLIFTDPMAGTLSAGSLTAFRLADPLCDANFAGGGECSVGRNTCTNAAGCAKNACVGGKCALGGAACANDAACSNPTNTCLPPTANESGPSCSLSHTSCSLGNPVGSCPNPFFPNSCTAGLSFFFLGTNNKCPDMTDPANPNFNVPACFGTCTLTGGNCAAFAASGSLSCQDLCTNGTCRFGKNSCGSDAACQNECVIGNCNVSDLVADNLAIFNPADVANTCGRSPVAGQ
jgi:hypothetical protein